MRPIVAAMSGLACSLLLNPAMAAESCVSPSDAMALKTAAVQQQLMVAAFMCHDAGAYNDFVHAYQADLQQSDASLKSYFVHRLGRRGEAAYDTYKTKAANVSALSQARTDILARIARMVEKGQIAEDRAAQAEARLELATGLSDFARADAVIEAIVGASQPDQLSAPSSESPQEAPEQASPSESAGEAQPKE